MKKTIPRWKRIVLFSRDWFADLEVPRPHKLPHDAEMVREMPDWTDCFMFYLYRDKTRRKYYFRAWPNLDHGSCVNPTPRDCIVLNPVEAQQLLILQEVSPKMAEDVRQYQQSKRKTAVRKQR